MQLKDAFDNDSSLHLDQRIASMRILGLCLEGAVEALASIAPGGVDVGMGRLTPVIPELISAMHASDLLLSPSEASRRIMWNLVFAFVEPLQKHFSFSQVSQLLYVALALAAKAPAETAPERAGVGDAMEALQFEEEELVDPDKLRRILDVLSSQVGAPTEVEAAAATSLDDLDDGPLPSAAPASADPRVLHLELFSRALPEVLARLDDSFTVFRSVLYLSPLSVLVSPEIADAVLQKLAECCGPTSSPPTKCAAHALGVHLAFRCATFHRSAPSGPLNESVRSFMLKAFQVMAKAQFDACKEPQGISYMVIISGLSLWRRFLLCEHVDPRDVLFPRGGEASRPMQWLTQLVADQELYKRFHAALERAELAHTGKAKDEFVVKTVKCIRETAEHRAATVRAFAASNLLMVLRRLLSDGRGPIPWARGKQAGSAHALFLAVTSLLRTSAPTLAPMFVKPTQPPMALYAAELLHLLLHQAPGALPLAPFRLLDDAARAIHTLTAEGSFPQLPLELAPEEHEALVADFVGTLVDLNLTLPPSPDAKHAPVSLEQAAGAADDIVLGDCNSSTVSAVAAHMGAGRGGRSSSMTPAPAASTPVPNEVTRLLAQSEECLRWNAALALYRLGVDLSVVCREGFLRAVAKWQKRREQAKVLVAADLLRRADFAHGAVSKPGKLTG